ncbi:MAG: hypothetical protein WBB28_01830 [Crinalium sp.]
MATQPIQKAPIQAQGTLTKPSILPQDSSSNAAGNLLSFFRVKIEDREFDSVRGEILKGSSLPYVWLSTRRHSEARFVINDATDELIEFLDSANKIEVEVGFVDGESRNKFTGKVFKFGRLASSYGTLVVAVDSSYAMQSSVGASSVLASEDTNIPGTSKGAALAASATPAIAPKSIVSVAGRKPISTASGKIAKPDSNSSKPSTPSSQQVPDTLAGINNIQGSEYQSKAETTPAESLTLGNHGNLKFAKDSKSPITKQGYARLQQSEMQMATANAALKGSVVIARGNTVREIAPDSIPSSGVILDYEANPALFISQPTFVKKSAIQLQSGSGAITVNGWSIDEKRSIGATVVIPKKLVVNPEKRINIAGRGIVKMGDPIYPGSKYTWGDALGNTRKIPTAQNLERIAAIAKAVVPLINETVGKQDKWEIVSWFHDTKGAEENRHSMGDAIDFKFKGNWERYFQSLKSKWKGGIAIKPSKYIHIDLGPRRTWKY